MRYVGAWIACLGLSGCFGPSFESGEVACGPQGECPSGLICGDGNLCLDNRSQPDADAAPIDDPSCVVCDSLATCEVGAESVTCACPAGYADENGDGSSCGEIDECDIGSDNCSADASCANIDGSFECTCNLGFAGDGVTCASICNRVLIFDDCDDNDGDCATIAETQFADDAAQDLGYQAAYFGPTGTQMFIDEFDAGNFDVLIIESSLRAMPAEVKSRTIAWLAGGGTTIFSYWDLDADAELQTALGVSTMSSISSPLPVVADANADPDVFTALEDVPDPITFEELMIDDGDELDPGQGSLLARFNDAAGPGAIALTNNDTTLVLGFLPVGMVFNGPADADNDGKNDVTELYTNLIGSVCGRIPPP